MSDDTFSPAQHAEIPPSFLRLYLAPGGHKLSASRNHVAARYDWCEDLAQMLTETAGRMQSDLGITEADVLLRCLQGLRSSTPAASDADEAAAQVAAQADAEAVWVVRRLAELMGWPDTCLLAG